MLDDNSTDHIKPRAARLVLSGTQRRFRHPCSIAIEHIPDDTA